MPYNFVADSIHAQNFVADFHQEVKCNFTRKTAVLHFQPPSGVSGNILCSSWAHLKAHTGLPIDVN